MRIAGEHAEMGGFLYTAHVAWRLHNRHWRSEMFENSGNIHVIQSRNPTTWHRQKRGEHIIHYTLVILIFSPVIPVHKGLELIALNGRNLDTISLFHAELSGKLFASIASFKPPRNSNAAEIALILEINRNNK